MSVEYLRERLAYLKEQRHHLSYDELRAELNSLVNRFAIPFVNFTNEPYFFNQQEYEGRNCLYRARPIENLSNGPFSKVSSLSYLTGKKLAERKYHGRFNHPQEAIFYGSLSPETACIETIHSTKLEGDGSLTLVVGTWWFKTTLTLAHLPVSREQHDDLFLNLDATSLNSQYNHEFFNEQRLWLEKIDLTENERILLLFFVTECCCYDIETDRDYLFTNFFSDLVFNKLPNREPPERPINGIIYPSIANAYQRHNVALTPKAVNDSLVFIAAEVIRVVWWNGGKKLQFVREDCGSSVDEGLLIKWERLKASQDE